jgi:hypothetical protein
MQHSGDPATLATLLESHNEIKSVFDTYKEMVEHGNYHRARAASQKVAHRGTGDAALIDFEVSRLLGHLFQFRLLMQHILRTTATCQPGQWMAKAT